MKVIKVFHITLATMSKLIVVLMIVFSYHRSDAAKNLNQFNGFDMVNFNLVYGDTHMNFTRFYMRDYLRLLNHERFLPDRKTVLYVHGWIEDFYSESTETVTRSYILRGDHNIIVLDWGFYSFDEYFTVIPRFTQISKMIAKTLIELFERGLDINKLHCVGHSFGSHICGIIGREIIRNSYGSYKLKRISALDPAHNGFWPPLLELPLSKHDAKFVDAIHSDVNFLGTPNRVAHVDFFPNNGQLQPGCPPFKFASFMDIVNSFCSHQHAWRYWADSVAYSKIFPAKSCNNYKSFEDGKCNGNKINFMGYDAVASAPGVFYLQLRSNRNYTVDESYYNYLATGLNQRFWTLQRIVNRIEQFITSILHNNKVR